MGGPLRDRWLLALMAGGLLVRAVAAVWTDPISVRIADDNVYARGAGLWRMTGSLETGELVRPPLYFLFIAATQALTSQWTLLAKLIQCLAGTLTAIPVYRSAFRLASGSLAGGSQRGTRVARLAAAFLLFDPTLIAYAHLLWPETLFLFVVALVFDGVSGVAPHTRMRSAALGAATGLAMLLKPVFGLFAAVLFFAWLRRFGWKGALAITLFFGGASALVISPWVIRNQMRFGPGIVIENEGPYSFWVGNDPRPPDLVHRDWKKIGDPSERSAVALRRGAAAVADDPGRFLHRAAARALNLWGHEFIVVRNLIHGGSGTVERSTILAVFWVLQVAHAAVLVAAAIAMGSLVRDPTLRLVLIFAGIFTLVASGTVSTTRWRIGLALPLAIGAGLGVERVARRKMGPGGWIAAALAAGLLLLSASRPPAATIATGDFVEAEDLRRPDWFYFRY